MLADGGNAIDAAFAANFVLGVVTPYMCGFGGDLLAMVWDGELHAYRGVGRAPAGATAEFVRDAVGRDRDADVRSASGDRARRGRGVVHAHREVRDPFVRRARAAGAALRGGGLPGHEARRVVLPRSSAILYDHFGLSDFHDAYGDVAAGDWVRQPELARTIRTLAADGPDAYYRGPIGAAIAERIQQRGRLHDRGRRRRARRRVGRAAARAVPRRRDPRDAAADAGRSPRSRRCASSTVSTSAPTVPIVSTS